MDISDVQKNSADTEVASQEVEEKPKIDLDRIHVKNVPPFLGFKHFRKMLDKVLVDIKPRRFRLLKDFAYVTFESPEDATKAIELLNGFVIKKFTLTAKHAETEVKQIRAANAVENKEDILKTAKDIVSPLADIKYDDQLLRKQQSCERIMDKMYRQLKDNKVEISEKQSQFRERLQKIIPSPKIDGYRNKCEFTIGRNLNGEPCVGFVGGRFAANKHYVLSPDDVGIVSTQMKAIVKDVEEFVLSSSLEPFDEFKREGFWRMLTVREFGGDVMLIFRVFPHPDEDFEKNLKERVAQHYLKESNFKEKKFRISSIYWQRMVHCSDETAYELVAGTPYIYESLLDCRFRVSPNAFFQTNSQAASVLYSTIRDSCGLKSENISQEDKKDDNQSDEVEAKRMKLVEEVEKENKDPGTVLLDICCGTGTIGQCLLQSIYKSQKVCCMGIEMIVEAVEDAKQNAKQNKMENCCNYIAGKAEDVFRSMKYQLPSGFDLLSSRVVGVLDPPRAGMHEKVILACRDMDSMKRLVFVSCDPNAAIKNIVDLCRPTSKKFYGSPFNVTKVQPIDMFPMTNHYEWVIQLDR